MYNDYREIKIKQKQNLKIKKVINYSYLKMMMATKVNYFTNQIG